MGLIEQATTDIQQFTSDLEGFGVAMTFTAPDDSTADVVGMHTKHHLNIDDEGVPVIGKNAHVSISEQLLTDAGYPVRNEAGDVDFIGHKVAVKDSTGTLVTYSIDQSMPDEAIGLIVCILGEYGED